MGKRLGVFKQPTMKRTTTRKKLLEIQVVAERSCALIATIAEDSQLVQAVLSMELQSLRSLWP